MFWVCVYSLMNPGCNAHAPCCHVDCPILHYFPTLPHKQHNSRKKLLNIKLVSRCSLKLVCNASHSKKKWARYYQKCVLVFMSRTHYSRQILMKLEFSRQFPKHTQISNFMKIRPMRAELLYAGQTWRSLIVAFRNSVNAPNNQPLNVVWRCTVL